VRPRLIFLAEADEGHHSPGVAAFAAVAEEQIGAASGTKFAHRNTFGQDACFDQNGAIRREQIQVYARSRRLVPRRSHGKPGQRIRLIFCYKSVERPYEPFASLGELARIRFGYFGADFVAATRNTGTERSNHVSGLRAENHLHPADCFCRDAPQRAAPACMHRGYHAPLWIREKDGNAIGSLHAEKQPRELGDGRIAAQRFLRRRFDHMNHVRVDLPQRNKVHAACTERFEQHLAIGEHILAGVPIGEAEVQHFGAVERAIAAGARAEAVDK